MNMLNDHRADLIQEALDAATKRMSRRLGFPADSAGANIVGRQLALLADNLAIALFDCRYLSPEEREFVEA